MNLYLYYLCEVGCATTPGMAAAQGQSCIDTAEIKNYAPFASTKPDRTISLANGSRLLQF
jgi:hypothetical protein